MNNSEDLKPDPERLKVWQNKAAQRGAIVPQFFEVFPDRAIIVCGNCGRKFIRNLVPNLNDPIFVCPEAACKCKNWLPVTFEGRK